MIDRAQPGIDADEHILNAALVDNDKRLLRLSISQECQHSQKKKKVSQKIILSKNEIADLITTRSIFFPVRARLYERRFC